MNAEKLAEKLAENEAFDWESYEAQGNAKTHNPKIKQEPGVVVYCREKYAEEMYHKYFAEDIVYDSKDLIDGGTYKCTIDYITEKEGFASTEGGATIYMDLLKERRDAKKLNIIGLDFMPGNKITLVIRRVNGNYYGSAIDHYVESLKAELFLQIKEEKSAYLATIESINNGGYIANISGIKCFLPGSLAAANKITDFESYIGKDVQVMVESYVASKDIFIISYKKYLEKIMEHKIQELDLTKKYTGSVTGTSSFGVFVEWEDIYTGLLHKTEIGSTGDLGNFSAGDEIEFYVKEVKENNRLTLTLSEPLEKTIKLYEIEALLADGEFPVFSAIVKHKRKNGALVEIPELSSFALVPNNNFDNNVDNLRTGDETQVKIYKVDTISGKIFAMTLDDK